jgi:putative hydrolase of the HAD superfamily
VSVRAVVSDFGGVLTTPMSAAFLHARGQLDLPPETLRTAMIRALDEHGEHPLYELEKGRISEREFHARIERALAEVVGREVSLDGFNERMLQALNPNDELFDYYRARRAEGVRFALCTNNVREWEPRWRPMLPIDEVFEFVVDSAFVGTRKPEPEIYAIVLERLGLPGEACAFVDDLEVNIEGAREAGMHAIRFHDTAQVIAELDAWLGRARPQPR